MTSVLSVSSEVFPLVKTGGLADVAGALPAALKPFGIEMRTLMPAYPGVVAKVGASEPVHRFPSLFGGPAMLLSAQSAGLDLLLLDAPHLYERAGGPYAGPGGYDHPDNWARFAALSRAAADIGLGAVPGFAPQIVHAHDWQGALAPVYLAFEDAPKPKTLVTIHNLAFQGTFPYGVFPRLGLPPEAWSIEGVEYYGSVGFLKGGIHACDCVTTVSPTYAREIVTPEGGMGLDGLLAGRGEELVGIVNGVDTAVWDPRTDPHIASNYDANDLDARRPNRDALVDEFALDVEDGPILAVVSRLTWQKGMDVLAEALGSILDAGVRMVIVGSGDRLLEGAFLAAQARRPGRVGVRIGYDEALAHRVQAGADALLVPSRFEPCGLTQLCALRYGCLPVVTRVGGLADTVIDANFAAMVAGAATGIVFSPLSVEALQGAVQRLVTLHANHDAWRRCQIQAMRSDVSWDASAARYASLYDTLLSQEN
ncbi:glycogen synthase GlgA [Aureimonas mangrovi]|uniref:glycogen synthase GlgA n=1 Tax=Aureimonas mangrovi TaxID=2758041 RepID=UPI00163DC03F|nr:glycogen synthase GlgA [Aureimonas mangrovi]